MISPFRGRGPEIALFALMALAPGLVVGLSTRAGWSDALYILALGVFFLGVYAAVVVIRHRLFRVRLARGDHGSPESLPGPVTAEAALVLELLQSLDERHRIENEALKNQTRDFADYLVAWAHEIKTPVATLRLLRENLAAASEPRIPVERLSDDIGDEVERVDSLVNQVLFAARAESFARDYLVAETHVAVLCRELVKTNARAFVLRGIGVDFKGPETVVLSDAKWLSFILQQIIANALSYTGRDGTVVFETGEREGAWILSVSDTGRGIPPEELGRVFDRGFTGSAGRPGRAKTGSAATGMGLYLAQRLAGELGHRIEIASVPGKGTDVTVVFPKHSDYLSVHVPTGTKLTKP